MGVYWDSSPRLSQNSAEVEKRRTQTSQRGFKSIPRVAFVNTETGELKKKTSKPTEALTGVSPSASHIWSSINAESPALNPSWSETLPPIKTTYRMWAETGTQQETKHKRDAAEHTGHDAAVCLHLKDRRNSGEDSIVLVYIARTVIQGLWLHDVWATLPLHKGLKTKIPCKMIFYLPAAQKLYSILHLYNAPTVLIWKHWLVD